MQTCYNLCWSSRGQRGQGGWWHGAASQRLAEGCQGERGGVGPGAAVQVHMHVDDGRTAGPGSSLACCVWAHPLQRASGVCVWGCIDESVPVCLCIYEPRGGGAEAGSHGPRLGMWNRGVGAVSTPSLLLASQNLHSSFIHRLLPSSPPPVSWGLSPPVPVSPACPRSGGGRLLPIPLAPGPLPRALLALRTLGRVGVVVGGGFESR